MSPTPGTPRISVVTATYNRSNVLRWTIASVLRQRITDLEHIVIGDACTDDTADVVAAFGDPRVRFTNLPANCGDQSGPNNAGIALARGDYVALVNHDDLWFPDHLSAGVELLESSGADFVFTGLAIALANDLDAVARGDLAFQVVAPPGDRWEPYVNARASTWIFRRELSARVGPWCRARESYIEPSQDWLFRAWRAGVDMRFKSAVTVLAIPSGARRDCYRNRDSAENELYWRAMTEDPTFRTRMLESAALGLAGRLASDRDRLSPLAIAYGLAYKPLSWLGVNPRALKFRIKYGSKGGLVNVLRRHRGLDEI
jgi:glycosyltransferase involved in cell wall biosynthesis